MKENNTIVKNKLDKLKIIFNNDVAILDFLCDMQDRKAIRGMQKLVDDSKELHGMLLINCPLDNMVVLLLINSPFGFNEGDNKLMLYADNSLRGLAKYFKNLLVNTSKAKGDIFHALDDITRYLYFTWVSEEDKDTRANYLG